MKKTMKTSTLLSSIALLSCIHIQAADNNISDIGQKLQKSTKIIGGSTVPNNDDTWRFTVALKSNENNSQICAGSLIAPDWVLTAAHCVEDATSSEIHVGVGSYDKTQTTPHAIDNIIVHENYDYFTNDNDIALVHLSEPVDSINVVPYNTSSVLTAPSTPTETAGWGIIEDGNRTNDLIEVLVPIIDRDTCNEIDAYDGEVTDNMLCAGRMSGGVDSCQGDSGGPLLVENTLVGIVSWGYGCALENHPGIYTNVKNYASWIESYVDDPEPETIPLALNTTANGEWTSEIESIHRPGKFAQYYTFTLTESTEVTIDLESATDTFLYLLEGSGQDGSVIQNNDDGGTGFNSRITRVLEAGTYTLEATTFAPNATGAFTVKVTVETDGGVTVPSVPTNLVANDVTQGSAVLVWNDTSDNESGFNIYAGSVSVGNVAANVDTYQITGLTSNTQYTYSVKAVNDAGESEAVSVTFTTENDPEPETIPLALNTTANGEWTSEIESIHRPSRFAQYYTFTLTESTEVTIDLESATDTFLYLLEGSGQDGSVIQNNDDGGTGFNSRITRVLEAGTYTLEATTFAPNATGAFTVRVNSSTL